MSGHALRLEPDELGGYRVELDGLDITSAVAGVELGHYDDQGPGVTLMLVDVSAHVDLAEAKVRLSSDAARVLELLGWTPPKTQPSPPPQRAADVPVALEGQTDLMELVEQGAGS